jgi:hypothetical protein
MSPEEQQKKNVEAGMRRITDGRIIVTIAEDENWGMSLMNACEAVKKKWKPKVEDLTKRVQKKVGLEDAPSDYDCSGMEAVLYHLQEMARDAFKAEMLKRGVESPDAEKNLMRLKLEKASQ